ncbi:hypothetical protein [Rhizobium binxianense]|uniref:hypothetical protein n=1 Tax=Rhizobium binxianense TaxID=3024242 RepID=UPI00234F81F8|nr:hypothetical protein [Rhizobium sp. BC56]MDC7742475.1 hypothetical protein [Rhizobium sp. BC56]
MPSDDERPAFLHSISGRHQLFQFPLMIVYLRSFLLKLNFHGSKIIHLPVECGSHGASFRSQLQDCF